MIRPIECLYDRIIDSFENANEIVKERLHKYPLCQLSRKIRIDDSGFRTPYADLNSNEIVLNQGYLSFLWGIIYVIIEVAGEKLKSASIINSTLRRIDSNDPDVDHLNRLMDWSLSLRDSPSDWPKDIPTPEEGTDNVRRANVFFIFAVNFIMYHEVSHLVNGHRSFYTSISDKRNANIPLSQDDYDTLRELEKEADNFAYESLISVNGSNDDLYHKTVSIILAWLSNLFCIDNSSQLRQQSHPDLHLRIYNVRQRNTLDEGQEFWLDNIMNVGISMFCRLHNIDYIKDDYANYTDVMTYLFDLLEIEARDPGS